MSHLGADPVPPQAGFPHREFVTTLAADPATFKSLLAAAWRAAGEYTPLPLGRVRELVAEKHKRDEWPLRR